MDRSNPLAAEQARSKNRDGQFSALMEAVVDAIIVINGNGTVEEFSSAASKMFGYERAEIIGKNVSVLMPEPYHSQHDQYIKNYLATGERKIIGIGREAKAQRKDGSVFPIDLAVGEVTGGAKPQFVGIIRDISERKAAEMEAREQRERLAHVTRLSTMGEMAAGIAHEVNQPLTAIATYSNACKRMLAAAEPDIGALKPIMQKLGDQAYRAGEVIRRLRSFVKRREGKYEQVGINELAHETVQLAEVDSRHHDVILTLEACEEDPLILADTVQIQQVLLNLIRNAIEAVADGVSEKRNVVVRTIPSAETARVEIIDRGAGLDETVNQNLFMPFQTTKESGMGMGLSISRSIIDAHKGALAYRENPEGGAIFYFDLPVVDRDMAV